MKTSEAFWMFLPEGLEELFEMVRFERSDKAYDIWMDKKKQKSPEDAHDPHFVARRYTDYTTNTGFPDARQTAVPAYAQEQVVGQTHQRDIQLQP